MFSRPIIKGNRKAGSFGKVSKSGYKETIEDQIA